MKSRGDSLAFGAEDEYEGVCASLSVAGGEYWGSIFFSLPPDGESPDDLARKLGIGKADGAGDAWKVAPANAVAMPDFVEPGR